MAREFRGNKGSHTPHAYTPRMWATGHAGTVKSRLLNFEILGGKCLPTKVKISLWVYTVLASKVYAFRKMCLKWDYNANHCEATLGSEHHLSQTDTGDAELWATPDRVSLPLGNSFPSDLCCSQGQLSLSLAYCPSTPFTEQRVSGFAGQHQEGSAMNSQGAEQQAGPGTHRMTADTPSCSARPPSSPGDGSHGFFAF